MNNRRRNSHDTRERSTQQKGLIWKPHARRHSARLAGRSAPSWPPSIATVAFTYPPQLQPLPSIPTSLSSHGPGTVTTAQEVGIRRRSGGADPAVCKHCKIASHAGRSLLAWLLAKLPIRTRNTLQRSSSYRPRRRNPSLFSAILSCFPSDSMMITMRREREGDH